MPPAFPSPATASGVVDPNGCGKSNIIDAVRYELRVFMEEAAGISRYKERSKETEQRMKQTRDNLDHLNDVQVELQKQLEKLQHEEKLLKAQLLAIRWLALDNAIQAKQALISEQAENLQHAIG